MGLAEPLAEQEAMLDAALKDDAFSFLSRVNQIENTMPRFKERHPAAALSRFQSPRSPSGPRRMLGSGSPTSDNPEAILNMQKGTDAQDKDKEVSMTTVISDSQNRDASKSSASEFHEKPVFHGENEVPRFSMEEESTESTDASVIKKLFRIAEKVKRMMSICKMDKKHLSHHNHIILSELREWRNDREIFERQIGSDEVDKQIQKLLRTQYWSLVLIKTISLHELEMVKRSAELENKAERLQVQCKQVHRQEDSEEDELLLNLLETIRVANLFVADYDATIKAMFEEICTI